MSQHLVTQNSSANAAQTLTITPPYRQENTGPTKKVLIHAITVSTSAADQSVDIGILLTNASAETWNAELRAALVHGAHFTFPHPIDGGHGACTITVDAAGAVCVTTVSVQYEII